MCIYYIIYVLYVDVVCVVCCMLSVCVCGVDFVVVFVFDGVFVDGVCGVVSGFVVCFLMYFMDMFKVCV